MSTSRRPYVPRLNPSCDVRKLAISPCEAYILSRIDGLSSASELGLITGMGDDIVPVLTRLHALGALLEGPESATSTPAPAPASLGPPPPAPAPAPTPSSRLKVSIPQAELDEDVEIDPAERRQILEMYYKLGQLSHYELFGIPAEAKRTEISRAYNQLVKQFHSDRYFRKNIGTYKAKLDKIFQHMTEATAVLYDKEARAAYDRELAHKRNARKPSAADLESVNLPASKPASIPPPREAPRATSAPPRGPSSAPPTPAPSTPPRPVVSSVPPAPPRAVATSTPPPRASMPPPSVGPSRPDSRPLSSPEDERRRVLASRLSGKWSGARPTSAPATPSTPPPESSPESSAQARDNLRRMAISHQIEQQREQTRRYLSAAHDCANRGDAVGAANSFRLALNNDPDNEQLQALVREWSVKASAVQAEQYARQGDAEASAGRWAEASRSYVRAATGRPEDPPLLEKAALALLRASGDLHLAADLARRAVSLRGSSACYRATLAEIYIAAGLLLNARRELAEAAKIEPENARVKALLKGLG